MDVAALRRRSVEVIREGQAPTGAYVACPRFPQYRYSWFRDGAFIADAMSRAGEPGSAEAFFGWCARTIVRHRDEPHLHARYTVEGDPVEGEWHTDQVDGIGTWLWALRAHAERHRAATAPYAEAVAVSRAYLERRRHEPSFDWWEEREGLHAATLACVRAGLEACGSGVDVDLALAEERLDASELVLVLWGYAGAEVVERVEAELLCRSGGLHRNRDDEYYGGGEWLLLKGFHGLALLCVGREAEARDALEWIAARAEPDGSLPEQSQEHLLRPDAYEPWVERWGPPASPLLWSHAMFLTLADELGA